MIKSRNRNIMIKTQFNINGSRGADAGKFIADYVSRDSATEPSVAYHHQPEHVPVDGDGVAFTLDQIAIDRKDTLDTAEHVQALHATGTRAIQQMVISFDQDYLSEQRIVPDDLSILRKDDYEGNYDDVRLRNSVQHGLSAMVEQDGYRNPKAIACIQRDTKHLHVHAVVYEDSPHPGRMRGYEEKGVIQQSSLNQLSHDIDRQLTLTKTNGMVPTRKNLMLDTVEENKPTQSKAIEPVQIPDNIQVFMRLYQLRLDQEEAEEQDQLADDAQSLAQHVTNEAAEQSSEVAEQSSASSFSFDIPDSSNHQL